MKIGFQEENVEWLFQQFTNGYSRLLLADETGLGKTYSAAGTIYKLAKNKVEDSEKKDKQEKTKKKKKNKIRFKVLYLCSNQMIARKNMKELCEKILEIQEADGEKNLLEEKESKKMFTKYNDRLSMEETEYKHSVIVLRNATINTSFQTYYNPDKNGVDIKKRLREEVEALAEKNKGIFIENSEKKKIDDEKFAQVRMDRVENNVKNSGYDLVILDEFQSYQHILSKTFPSPDSESKVIRKYIEDLFPNTKILMLSATPFRMETKNKNTYVLTVEEKLANFKNVLEFIANGVKVKNVLSVQKCFEDYKTALQADVSKMNFQHLCDIKDCFEVELKKVCRRNQRNHAMNQNNDFYEMHICKNLLYKDSLKAEAKEMKKYSIAENKGENEEDTSEPITGSFSSKTVRNCPYPAAFSKGYKAWQEKKYVENCDLFPEYDELQDDNSNKYGPNCKNTLTDRKNITESDCERVLNVCNVKFKDNSTKAACATKIIESTSNVSNDMNDIYKCAWIPSAKSRELGGPFKSVGNNHSKLLAFVHWKMEERYLAAYLSSKAYCYDQNKYDVTNKWISDNLDEMKDVLYKHCKCAYSRRKLHEGEDDTVIEAAGRVLSEKLVEYFKKDLVKHILANAGVKDKDSFEEYTKNGDLTSALEEYMYQTKFKLSKETAAIINFMHSRGIVKGNMEATLTRIYEELLLNNETQKGIPGICEDEQSVAQTLYALRNYLSVYNEGRCLDISEKIKDLKNKNPKSEEIYKWLVELTNGCVQKYRMYIKDTVEGKPTEIIQTAKRKMKFDEFVKSQIRILVKTCLNKGKAEDDIQEEDILYFYESFNYNYDRHEGIINDVKLKTKKLIYSEAVKYIDNGMTSWKGFYYHLALGEVGVLKRSYCMKLKEALESTLEEFVFYPEQKICMGYQDGTDVFCGRLPIAFACRYTDETQDVEDHNTTDQVKIMKAFNSPFLPFVLIATDVAKEGISFHDYCRKIVHLNVSNQPAVVIQRNGRIDRFHSLAIRQRVVDVLGENEDVTEKSWEDMFETIETQQKNSFNGMVPHWYISGTKKSKIEEYVFETAGTSECFSRKDSYNNIILYKQMIGSCLPDEMLDELKLKYPGEDLSQLNLRLI